MLVLTVIRPITASNVAMTFGYTGVTKNRSKLLHDAGKLIVLGNFLCARLNNQKQASPHEDVHRCNMAQTDGDPTVLQRLCHPRLAFSAPEDLYYRSRHRTYPEKQGRKEITAALRTQNDQRTLSMT